MNNVLIVSRQKDVGEALAKQLRPFKFNTIDITDSAQDARRRIQNSGYNLVLINTPLSHEFGTELALDIMEVEGTDVILIVKNDVFSDVEQKLIKNPVLILSKPINKQLMYRDINYILNSQSRLARLQKQNKNLKKKMSSLKDQFRAKLLLMENLNMTENEAHRYLQKRAMDEGRTPGAIALAVINLYDK